LPKGRRGRSRVFMFNTYFVYVLLLKRQRHARLILPPNCRVVGAYIKDCPWSKLIYSPSYCCCSA
jgi:hypothetical protein